jgi:tRNA-dihydrouridine synthase B
MWLNFTESKPILFAPMAGISDSPARRLAMRFGADMTISELISSEGIIRGCPRTWKLAEFDGSERPIGLQIFGARPESMAKAARQLSELKPDSININFGCPARKIVGKNGGSSILRNLALLKDIVTAVVKAVDIPVTAKMRSGWDSNELTYLEAGKIIEEAGAVGVVIHPRTRTQGFSGHSDWQVIKALKDNLKIKVIGNGDISTPEDARRMIDETDCDGIMIGRGAIANPWIFKRIKHYLTTGQIIPAPAARKRVELAIEHLGMEIDYYGLPHAVFRMRSQFCYYLRGLPGNSDIRITINRLLDPDEIKKLLFEYVDRLESESQFQPSQIIS